MSNLVYSCLAGAALAGLLAAPAVAQNADRPVVPADDSIVVTGSLRATPLQDMDASVTVLDRRMIEEARLRDVRRLDDLVPNVQFNESGQLSNIFITIRGVESNPFIVNRAAIYIDGIPFRELTNAVLSQIDSIEVLRGPQGALYGANSESGLIVVRSRAPSARPEVELRATGSLFSGSGGGSAEAYVSAPISSTLAGSITGSLGSEAAYRRNLVPGAHPGRIDEVYIHGRLRWTPTDRLTVNATAYLLDLNAPGIFDQDFHPLDRALYDASYGATFNGGKSSGDYGYLHDAPSHTDETEHVLGLSASQKLGAGSLELALSYRRDKSDSRGLDFDFTALPTAAGREANDDRFWTAELRYVSPGERPLSYILGASFYRSVERNTKATFVGPGTLDSYVAAPTQERRLRDIGLFGSLNYRPAFLPGVTLSAGLRYDDNRQDATQQAGLLDLGGGYVLTYTAATLRSTDNQWLPRFSAKYEPDPDLTVFATVAKGYIPGGFNLTATQEGITDPDVLRFRAETMWSHELGFRVRSADRRFHASGAIFLIRSDNWQEIRVLTDASGRPVSSDFIGSSSSIESKGFELEASFRPIKAFTLAANFGLSHARYNYLFDGLVDHAGNRVKLVPDYDSTLSARYELPFGLFARGEVNFIGKMALDETSTVFQKAVTLFNLQIGLERQTWSLRLFGENITNVRRFSGLAFDNLAFGADGNKYAPLEAPRTIGVELSKRF
jgi:iron complex outermembrane receptor protein